MTGASSGIGIELARELARLGADLVLVARRGDRLRALAEEIGRSFGVRATVEARDLSQPGERRALVEALEARGTAVDVLVNDAGFGMHGAFIDIPWEREREEIEVDVVALVELTKSFAKPMVARGFGRILQVASTVAYQPSPGFAIYGAAKAFVLSFGEALRYELRGTGVTCTVVSPGITQTEFFGVAGQRTSSLYYRTFMMRPADVARVAVRALLRGKRAVVPGRLNALGAWLAAHLSRRFATWVAARILEGSGPEGRGGAEGAAHVRAPGSRSTGKRS